MGYDNEFAGRQVVLDIETVGCPEAAAFLDPVKAPANYKDPDKIAAYCTDALTKQVEKASLEPDLCEVVAVGFRHPEYARASAVYTRLDGTESDLLALVWEAVDGRAVVGFNVLGFDLPVLVRRSQLLNVPHPTVNLDRYRTPHVDLLERLSFNGKLTYRSLAFYCRRFGIPCEDVTTGAEIASLVAAQDWPAVAEHCRADVDKTTALAVRLRWLRAAVEEQVA
jgi:3'-5' exonuclease